MLKILAAASLLILTLMPATAARDGLEKKLRSTIDRPAITAKNEGIIIENLNTTEAVDSFKDKSIGARAAYFIDTKTGQVLYQKNEKERLPMASITKLMTAIIVMRELEPEELIVIGRTPTRSGDSTMGLRTGDKLSVDSLLHGLLLNSGSDAALTLAVRVSGSEPEFVALMNEEAKILGLKNTQFTNPVGWDESGNYSTAHDLTILAKTALTNPRISEIVQKKSATVRATNGRNYLLTNTNLLLDGKSYLGIKTGTTYLAGECLATHYKDSDKELIGVILNSPSRFSETVETIRWITRSYRF